MDKIYYHRLFCAVILLMSLYSLIVGAFAYIIPGKFFEMTAHHTGAFNPHFVRDVGAAFITSGVLLLLAFLIEKWRTPCAIAGALFLFLHGLIHWQELQLVGDHAHAHGHIFSEILTVLLPAAVIAVAVVYDSFVVRR